MKKTPDEQIAEKFPPLSYEEDRAKRGHMTLVEETRRQLAEGVCYRECLYTRGDGTEVAVYLAVIEPDAPVQLAVSAAPLRTVKPVREHARSFENAFGVPVYFAMNAGFFHFFRGGDLTPYGIQIMRGVEMALPALQDKDSPWYSHNFLAVDREGKAFVSNSDEFYRSLRGKLSYAVGGGFRLIRDGRICLCHDQQGGEYNHAPRTVVGFAEDGTIILLCADGRSKRSGGLCYGDIVEIYLQQGKKLREVLNLDGGGSTTVVVREEDGTFAVKNVPSGPQFPISYRKYGLERPEPQGDGQERSVADAVLIIPK